METIEFYYDIVCPYAYIASRRLERLAERTGAEIRWVPILLGGVYKALDAPQVPAQGWPQPKQENNARDLFRQAEKHGVPLRMPSSHPMRTVEAMRLLCACPTENLPSLTRSLYSAYWERGEDVRNPELLDALGSAAGVEKGAWKTKEAKESLFKNTALAVSKGAFGVPSFFIGSQMWWGQDRMHFLEAALGKARKGWPRGRGSGQVVDFFHDFASPFSYLAALQIDRAAEACGFQVRKIPILLGALFRQIGTADVPLFTMPRQKQAYMSKDLGDWADWWGLPFTFPRHFPLRSVLPLRVSIAVPEATEALYTAYWSEGRDISKEEVVSEILLGIGEDPSKALSAAGSTEIKEQLFENTRLAVESGVFGVPTFRLGKQLWWGQDRLTETCEAVIRSGEGGPP